MNAAEKKAAMIGGAVGGLAGLVIAKLRRSTRKGCFFYTLAGVGGGGLAGYGFTRATQTGTLSGIELYPEREERIISGADYPSNESEGSKKKTKYG